MEYKWARLIGGIGLSLGSGAGIALAQRYQPLLWTLFVAGIGLTIWGVRTDKPEMSGGAGGKAKAREGGAALGGRGGAGDSLGPGGAGGDAEAQGEGSSLLEEKVERVRGAIGPQEAVAAPSMC